MGVDIIKIEGNYKDKDRQKNMLFCIIMNLVFLPLGLFNQNMFSIMINMCRISLLLLFEISILNNNSSGEEPFIKGIRVSSIILFALGIFYILNIGDRSLELILLTTGIKILTIAIYLLYLNKKELKVKKIYNFYIVFFALYVLSKIIFKTLVSIKILMIFNNALSLLNIILLESNNRRFKRNYSLLKVLCSLLIILNLLVISMFLFSEIHTKLIAILIDIFLFNITYYVYKYTIKCKLEYSYTALHESNKALKKNTCHLDNVNIAIQKDIEIQNRLKVHIEERNELLNQVLDIMPCIWIITDYELNIIYTNNKFKKVFSGCTVEKFYSILDEIDNRKYLEEELKKIEDSGKILDKIIYINNNPYLLNITNNKSDKKYLITFNNINKELKMEFELENIKDDYEKIIKNIPCPILVRTENSGLRKNRVISVNKAFEKEFGFTKSEVMESCTFEYNLGDLHILNNINFKRLELSKEDKLDKIYSSNNTNENFNCIIKNKNNSEYALEVRKSDYYINNELHKLLNFKDITKKVNITEKINEQKLLYEKLLDNLPEAILLEDISTGRSMYYNKVFKELFGIKNDLLGVIAQKYRNIIMKKYINNINRGERNKTIYVVNENNEIKEVKVVSRKLYFRGKKCKVRIIKNIGDNLENIKLREVLIKQREYDKMKMEFYANISHELKTPLNNIYSSVQLIENLQNKNKIKGNKNIISEHIEITKQNMFRLLRLIENIINISQVKSDVYQVKSRNFDIIYIVERIVKSINGYARSKGITLIFDSNKESLIVGLDPESIERIILNILSNSIKFTLSGGEILVDIYSYGDTVDILIRDTGVGIEKEKLAEIFERFEQIENSNISNEFGSGIGLCLAKSLVELQNGKIYIDSEIGKGTTTKIQFPIKEVDEIAEDTKNYNNNIEKFEIEFFDIYK